MRLTIFIVFLIFAYSAVAKTLKETVPEPVIIYYPNGMTYTLKPDEVVHIAKLGDTVYTKAEGDKTITFTINYPNNKRDFDLEVVPFEPALPYGE